MDSGKKPRVALIPSFYRVLAAYVSKQNQTHISSLFIGDVTPRHTNIYSIFWDKLSLPRKLVLLLWGVRQLCHTWVFRNLWQFSGCLEWDSGSTTPLISHSFGRMIEPLLSWWLTQAFSHGENLSGSTDIGTTRSSQHRRSDTVWRDHSGPGHVLMGGRCKLWDSLLNANCCGPHLMVTCNRITHSSWPICFAIHLGDISQILACQASGSHWRTTLRYTGKCLQGCMKSISARWEVDKPGMGLSSYSRKLKKGYAHDWCEWALGTGMVSLCSFTWRPAKYQATSDQEHWKVCVRSCNHGRINLCGRPYVLMGRTRTGLSGA